MKKFKATFVLTTFLIFQQSLFSASTDLETRITNIEKTLAVLTAEISNKPKVYSANYPGDLSGANAKSPTLMVLPPGEYLVIVTGLWIYNNVAGNQKHLYAGVLPGKCSPYWAGGGFDGSGNEERSPVRTYETFTTYCSVDEPTDIIISAQAAGGAIRNVSLNFIELRNIEAN